MVKERKKLSKFLPAEEIQISFPRPVVLSLSDTCCYICLLPSQTGQADWAVWKLRVPCLLEAARQCLLQGWFHSNDFCVWTLDTELLQSHCHPPSLQKLQVSPSNLKSPHPDFLFLRWILMIFSAQTVFEVWSSWSQTPV
jgi:hypothetical protein